MTPILILLAGLAPAGAQCVPTPACPAYPAAYRHSPPLASRPGVLPSPCTRPAAEAATVYFDSLGVPHIIAATESAALYALGRQHMRDFPSQCSVNIWGSTGRLAALAGSGPGGRYAEMDFEARQWRYPEAAIGHWNAIASNPASTVLPLLCAYTAGLNDGRLDACAELAAAGLASLCGQTSEPWNAIQFANVLGEPIAPVDVLCFAQRFLGFFPRMTMDVIRASGAPVCPTLSNMWAINPAARAPEPGTSSTGPLLASDPHITPFLATFRAAFATLHCPSTGLDAGGWWIPGLPGPAMGGTAATAWAATGGAVASAGVWQAQATGPIAPPGKNPGIAGGFLLSGTPRNIYGVRERIDVRDPSGAGLHAYQRDLYWADPYGHGPAGLHYPAFPDYDGSAGFEYRSGAFLTTPESFFSFLIALLKSQTIGHIDSAIAMNVMVDQNFLAVASDGSMRYWLAGRRPDRTGQAAANAWTVLDGNSAADVWDATSVVPSSTWPSESAGPAAGPEVWINNNVDPRHTRRPTTIAPPWPAPWTMTSCGLHETYRQVRARALLDPNSPGTPPSGLTRSASIAALLDIRDNWAETMLPYFASAYLDLLGQGVASPSHSATVAAFAMPLLDGTWAPRDARAGCEYAARAWVLRHAYLRVLDHLRTRWNIPLPRLAGEHHEPALLPPFPAFSAATIATGLSNPHSLDILTLGVALEFAAVDVWPSVAHGNQCWMLLNPSNDPFSAPQVATFPGFAPPPCAPPAQAPCPAFPLLTLGQIRLLDLSRGSLAVHYPMGGVFDSLFASPTIYEASVSVVQFTPASCSPIPPLPSASPGAGFLASLGSGFGFDTTAPLFTTSRFLSPQIAGSRSILSIDLSTPVRYDYAAAVGPTERLFDVRRYAPAPCFAARTLSVLEMDPAVIASTHTPVSSWTY